MDHAVVVVGSINVDLLLIVDRHPRPGETLLGGSGTYGPGGKGANQAVAAARLGARTAMVGAVGGDATAGTALSLLADASVDLTAVESVPGPTGLAVVTLAADGENTIIVVPGANATVTTEAVSAAAPTITAAAVCVLQCEIPLDAVREAAEVAAAADVRVVLNVAPAAALPRSTLRLADPLVVNQHEAAIVLEGLAGDGGTTASPSPTTASGGATASGSGSTDDDAPGDDLPPVVRDAVRAAQDLRGHGVRSVVVTLGAHGAVVVDDDGWTLVEATPVRPLDTTGAGDAFVGAMAGQLAEGADLRSAAAHASRVAAWSVQRLGAQASYPWKDDPLP